VSEGSYDGRSVLVTGAQGFIGSHLAERLLGMGARVVVPRRDRPARSYFAIAGLEERCDVVHSSLDDYESLLRVIAEHEIDVVFHLAAQTLVGTAARSPLSTFEANVRGTYLLLEACRAAGVVADPVTRVVVASSDKAYGRHEELPYREDAPLQPIYPYDVSKGCTDMIARSYAHTFGLPVAVTRLANVYGPGDFNMSRLVPETARALVEGDRPVIRSDGSPQRDFIYVDDAVDAYLTIGASLDRPEMAGRAWNAGAGEPVSVLELVRRMVAASGREVEPDIRGEGVPAAEIDRQWLDSTLIEQELGWRPRWGLDDGLAATWEWYSRHLRED
jgi:CDP-glucose 4,6-dehydratase